MLSKIYKTIVLLQFGTSDGRLLLMRFHYDFTTVGILLLMIPRYSKQSLRLLECSLKMKIQSPTVDMDAGLPQ